MTDCTMRGSLACVSRESQTPNTSEVGASRATAVASPVSRNKVLKAALASSASAVERTSASPSRCPAWRMEMDLSLP